MESCLAGHLELDIPTPFMTCPALAQAIPIEEMQKKNKFQKHSLIKSSLAFGGPIFGKMKKTSEGKNMMGKKSSQGKQSFKKQVIYVKLHENTSIIARKGIMSKGELDLKIKASEERKTRRIRQSAIQSIFSLENRSSQLSQELKKIHTERHTIAGNMYQSNSSASIETGQTFDSKANMHLQDTLKVIQKIPQSKNNLFIKIDDLHQNLEKGKKNKCFYDKLKQRLMKEMKKINDKNDIQKINILDSGCITNSYLGKNFQKAFRAPLSERSSPRITLARSSLETTQPRTPLHRKRPLSSSSNTLQKKQIKYASQKIDEQLAQDIGKKPPKKKNKKKAKSIGQFYEPALKSTLRHIMPLHKNKNLSVTKGEVQKQKIKEKMLNILIDCHEVGNQNIGIEEGLKIFQRYSHKLKKKLAKTIKIIGSVPQPLLK